MPQFRFSATDKLGKRRSGSVEAANRSEAAELLAMRGLTPITVDSDQVEENLSEPEGAEIDDPVFQGIPEPQTLDDFVVDPAPTAPHPHPEARQATMASTAENTDRSRPIVWLLTALVAMQGMLIVLQMLSLLIWVPISPTQFEYRIESPTDMSLERQLSSWGAAGWEVVFARRAKSSITDEFSYEMILKREK
ncbi:hypothetical protein GC163_21140 [bacterium]|nr:hypothetical protein [bacterium]